MALSRTQVPDQIFTGKLAGTVTAQRFVTGTLDAVTQLASAANCLGVSEVGGSANDLIPVNASGIFLVECGAAITAGARVESDSSGRAVTLAAGKALGVCLTTTTALGQFCQVLLISQ